LAFHSGRTVKNPTALSSDIQPSVPFLYTDLVLVPAAFGAACHFNWLYQYIKVFLFVEIQAVDHTGSTLQNSFYLFPIAETGPSLAHFFRVADCLWIQASLIAIAGCKFQTNTQ